MYLHLSCFLNTETSGTQFSNLQRQICCLMSRFTHSCTALTPVFLSVLRQGQHRSKMTPTLPRRNGQLGSINPLPLRLSLLVLLLLSAGSPGARCLDFGYHDARALHDFLVNVTHTYPSISRLYSVGRSVRGGSSLLMLLLLCCHSALPSPASWAGAFRVGRRC